MSDERTARLAMPLLQPGQAQKEMFHNEALALIDLAVAAAVRGVGRDDPPADPVAGDCWIVGSSPTGAWAGHAGALAGWTAGGWRLVAPVEGWAMWNLSTSLPVRYFDGAWVEGDVRAHRVLVDGVAVIGAQRAAIQAPAGGATIDASARETIGAILAALRGHGLIAT